MATDRNPLSWTSAQILSDVRRRASLPTTSTDWTDAVILREATEVLWDFAGWAMASSGEGRMLSSLDRPITATLTGAFSSGSEVQLPPLAIASTLEMVTWTNATGQNEYRLTRLDAAQEATYATPADQGDPNTYTLVGDRIRLYPQPNSGGILRITYQRRHPELVADSAATAGTVSIAPSTAASSTVTLTMALAVTGLAVGDTVDVLSSSYPYSPILQSAEVTAIVGTTVTVDRSGAFFTNVGDMVGARVVRSGQSPYVQLPLEFRTCVTEKIAANILRTLGDLQGMQAAEASATMGLARVMQMLNPRVKRDKPKAINPSSLMRGRFGRGGSWGRW